MTKPALILACRASTVTSAWPPVSPGLGRDLCIYCPGKFVFWSPPGRLPSANCPGCRQRGGRR